MNKDQLYQKACKRLVAAEMKVEALKETCRKANVFVDDVMPQIGGLCIQDFENLNLLCMELSKLKREAAQEAT